MAKLTRQTLNVFGISAGGSDIGVFGSLANGTPTYSSVIATIQSLPNWDTGWAAETIATNRPALEDFNAYCYVHSYEMAYVLQMGIPEWDAGTTYYENSYVQISGTIYYSLQDNNLNQNPVTETSYWTSGVKGGVALPNIYPVGSIYITTSGVNPSTTFGFGTWVSFGAGRMLVGVDAGDSDFNTSNKTGGAKTHTHDTTVPGKGWTTPSADVAGLSVYDPYHPSDWVQDRVLTSGTNSALPAYITAYMWLRTA